MANKAEKFLTAIDENKRIIYKIVNAYAINDEDNKDLVQEIIFQLWRSFESFGQRSSLSTWIYRVAFNVSVSHRRKYIRRQRVNTPITDSVFFKLEQETNEVDEKIELLQKCIKELKSLDKALIILYLEGHNHHEIAEILGLTPTNVSTKIMRVKKQLKLKMESAMTK